MGWSSRPANRVHLPRQKKARFFDGRSDGKAQCPNPSKQVFMRGLQPSETMEWGRMRGTSFVLRWTLAVTQYRTWPGHTRRISNPLPVPAKSVWDRLCRDAADGPADRGPCKLATFICPPEIFRGSFLIGRSADPDHPPSAPDAGPSSDRAGASRACSPDAKLASRSRPVCVGSTIFRSWHRAGRR